MKLFLDTHILIYAAFDSLDRERKRLLSNESHEVLFSDISLWEISKLFELKRLRLESSLGTFLRQISNHPNLERVHLEPEILNRIPDLSRRMHQDPADQIIAASALETRSILITDDEQLRSYSWLDCG